METTTSERLSRYRRHRHVKPTFALQTRDVDIVRMVAEYRVVSSEDICLLAQGSAQGVLRRLQKLFHHGYVDRPRSQRQRGNTSIAYALGQRGAELLTAHDGTEWKVDWAEKNRQLGAVHLEHALMVSRFHAALQFALAESGTGIIERWLPDGAVRDAVTIHGDGRSMRIPIAPDALFTVRLLHEPEGQNRVHACLEADRGTMTSRRYFDKLTGYWHWWRNGGHEPWGMRNFLVVTVTRSAERAANLCEVARGIDYPNHRGLGRFLFATETCFTQGGSPMDLLNRMFTTPEDDAFRGLLE